MQRRATQRTERPISLNQGAPWEKTRQFLALKFQEADIVTRKNKLRDEVSAHVDASGETDEKGSKFWKLDPPIEVNGQKFTEVKRERRVSQSLDEEKTDELVTAKGVRDRVFKTVEMEVLDQDELYVLNQEGLLSDEEIDGLWVENVSFAFKPIRG
ncbi:hypothetical protein ACFRNJ_12075 [Streptomyces sp. NPDC056721]|uniref:hypothetical protein n=1 Tax=Streptomyces sp. NPDC056721 TaxID=3345923 RepID=UPI0036C9C21E